MRSHVQNVAVGRAKKQAGQLFEAWLDWQHAHAIALGYLAHVQRNEPGTRMVRGKVIYTAKAGTDYSGTLASTGKSFAAEAKSIKGSRLARSLIAPQQQAHLSAVAKAGGLALLLVEFRDGCERARFAAPWMEIPWQRLRTAESVDARALKAWVIGAECYLERFAGGRDA